MSGDSDDERRAIWRPPPADRSSADSGPAPLPLPDSAPFPPPPIARGRRRPVLVAAAVLCLVAAVATALTAYVQVRQSHGPAAVAKRYFAAIADDDASRALAFAATPPAGSAAQFLTAEVLDEQLRTAKLTHFTVTTTTTTGSTATVDVRYVLGFPDGPKQVADTVRLADRGSGWRLNQVAATIKIPDGEGGSDRLTFAGRPMPTSEIQLFPGALPVGTDSPAVVVAGNPAAKLSDSAAVISVVPTLTSQARQQVADGMDAALTKCLASTSTDPLCPIAKTQRPVPGSLHGTLTKKVGDSSPSIDLDHNGKGLITVSVEASVDATWKVWNFDNQQVAEKGSTMVYAQAIASVDNPRAVSWVEPRE